jgi:isopenicillin-N epimerase
MTQQNYRHLWDIKSDIFINHGSFGATPRAVLEKQTALEKEFNASREQFFKQDCEGQLVKSKELISSLLGMAVSDFVFVDNITEGFNTVIKSLPLQSGDEVIVTNHAYGSFLPVVEAESQRRKFKIVKAEIPYSAISEEAIIDEVISRVTSKTKLCIIDHITSPTALIFPVKRIVKALRERGVEAFIDGAHAPGQINLNVEDIGAAYYSANHHKWLCAPVSSGFLYVRPDLQSGIQPLISSYATGEVNDLVKRFAWPGTRNVSARILVGETIVYMESLFSGGWGEIIERNHNLAVEVRDLLCAELNIPAPCGSEFFGSMFTIPIGQVNIIDFESGVKPSVQTYTQTLQRFGFGMYIEFFDGQYWLRVTCHLYNSLDDYKKIAEAVRSIT